jgi:hypothetical protein
MVITPFEYSEKFLIKGKKVSPKTIIRRCDEGLLPSNHHARQLPSESGDKGQWIIEIPDEVAPIVATKLNPTKPDLKTMNRKYFSFR